MSASGGALSSGRVTARVPDEQREAPRALVGALIADKYSIEAVVGEGSMGVVLRARHLALREAVAIKILQPALARDAQAVARFLREARALARMRSDHVARVMDVGTLDDGSPFLVMELLEGCDLAAEIAQRSTLPLREAIEIVDQIATAMHEAHALGVVHRDLKPSNVFLSTRPDGKRLVKVIDFGIARGDVLVAEGESDLTAASCVLGSPAYMAPEQVRSADCVDARSDVWSLGVILYEMLAGEPPFGSGSTTAVLAAICGDEPEPLDRVSGVTTPAVAAVVARCLSKNPEQRISTMRELRADLQRALSGLPPSSVSRRSPTKRPLSSVRWLVVGASAVGLAASFVSLRAESRWLPERSTAAGPIKTPLPRAERRAAGAATSEPVPVVRPTRIRRPTRHARPSVTQTTPTGDLGLAIAERK